MSLRHSILLVLIASFILCPRGTKAQDRSSISLGGDILVPIGQLSKEALTGFGPSARVYFEVSKSFALSFSVSYASFEGKADSGIGLKGLPVRVGGRLFFMENSSSRFYLAGDAGAFIQTGDQEVRVFASVAPMLGVEFLLGFETTFDVSVRYDIVRIGALHRECIGVRIGTNFAI